jgi:EAL domain-containing protein (putative c-di-GMP-specific phosphodiesterase class I)
LAAAVVMFAFEIDASVVAEGVETQPEYETLCTLGLDAAQGYLLGRPTIDELEWQSWQTVDPTREVVLP